jgi:hypothetical protein
MQGLEITFCYRYRCCNIISFWLLTCCLFETAKKPKTFSNVSGLTLFRPARVFSGGMRMIRKKQSLFFR